MSRVTEGRMAPTQTKSTFYGLTGTAAGKLARSAGRSLPASTTTHRLRHPEVMARRGRRGGRPEDTGARAARGPRGPRLGSAYP